MKFLNNISKHNNQIERIKALREMFRYNRPEDMAKIFELGRIEALHNLRQNFWITIIGVLSAFIGIFGFIFIPVYVDSVIDSRVEKEIDKRIDRFSSFYSYSKEVIPIMEHEFYRIKSVRTILNIKNNQSIEKLLNGWQISLQLKLIATLVSGTNKFEFALAKIDRRDSSVLHDTDLAWSKQIYGYLLNRHIDGFQNFDYLEMKIVVDIDMSQYDERRIREFSEKLDNYIESIDTVEIETHVNKVSLYKNIIRRNEWKKLDTLEYLYRTRWRDIFDGEGSIRKLYIKLVSNEQKKSAHE